MAVLPIVVENGRHSIHLLFLLQPPPPRQLLVLALALLVPFLQDKEEEKEEEDPCQFNRPVFLPPPLDGPSSSTTTTGTVLPESGLDGGGPVPSSVPDSSSSLLGVPAPTRAPSVPWGDNGGGGGPSLAVGAPTPVYSQQPLTSQPPYVIANAGGPPHTDPTNHTKKIPPSTKSSRCTNWSKSMQLPCHVGYSLWEHPVSWLVVLLSLYGLYAIRQQRHRRALTAVRGEYRQVAARDADRAFDDEDEPDDDEYYNDDNDDNDNDAWMVNGSIQMKSLGQEGLSLEETNG